jgi:23S rRNA (adenine2503-C2)-methyltransferase
MKPSQGVSAMTKPDLRSLLKDDVLEFCTKHNQPKFRADQILDWLYQKRVEEMSSMLNLPQALRNTLNEEFCLNRLSLERVQGSKDTTRKFLVKLHDDQLIETVLIPASVGLYGEQSDRHTLCVSSQVGCAYGCKFCASGLDGFRRNLTADEIIGQFMLAEKESGQKINNVVFMGMGEPLANYKNLIRAIRIMNAPWGLGLGARKITVSTSGLAPQIRQLSQEDLQIRLAISLHGARDEVRNKIMPVNQKFPLKELIAACEDYQKVKGRLITFEYILIDGINDDPEEARPLADLARRSHAKVNLIPFNEVEETGFKRPSDEQCERFRAAVAALGTTVTLRTEKGHDIDAACGQLRLREVRQGH